LVEQRRSQICLGLDPDPQALLPDAVSAAGDDGSPPAVLAGRAVAEHCRLLVERAGPACVAVKLQLACFERLGAPGRDALDAAAGHAREAGLLVIADGKRGDVPVTAAAYGQSLTSGAPTPWGQVPGLGADAFTANPLLGADSLEPLIAAAEAADAGVFVLVRTSNPGATEIQDADTEGRPLYERLAALVEEQAERLVGDRGLSGLGAVVGATEPGLLGRLRELMPRSIFLLPGVGAQGGDPALLGPAFAAGQGSAIVTASRSLAGAEDPGAAAEDLRASVWALGGGPD
jgi:orotidine-5'-phosphate decarboxylase